MRRELGMAIALLAMCLGLWVSNPDFLGQSNTLNTLRQISMLGIFSVGMGFVVITGGIDLSIGSIIGLTGVVIAKVSSHALGSMGEPLWMGILIGIGAALAVGLVQGLLITRLKLQPFIVTLAGMLLVRGMSQTIVQGGTLSLEGSPLLGLANGGFLHYDGQPLVPYPLVIFLAVVAVGAYVLHFTVYGRYVYAIGGNREAARYSGIDVKNVEMITYVISAGLGGVAGVCYASYIGQMSQQVGVAYEMYAIAAVVLGGCSLYGGEGTVLGIVIGSAIMRVIDNGINMFQVRYVDADSVPRVWRLDPNWTFMIIGAVILLAVMLDQIVHMLQDKRRIQRAGAVPGTPAGAALATAPAAATGPEAAAEAQVEPSAKTG